MIFYTKKITFLLKMSILVFLVSACNDNQNKKTAENSEAPRIVDVDLLENWVDIPKDNCTSWVKI